MREFTDSHVKLVVITLVSVSISLSSLVYADQQICNQFNNNQITCQNYSNTGDYKGQDYYQRQGNSNQWYGQSDES